MATAGSIVVDLVMRTGMFETDSKRAEKRLQEIAKRAKEFGAAVGVATAAAATALGVMVKQSIDAMDSMSKLAQSTGVAVEGLSALAYAGDLSDVSQEALGASLVKLTKNMSDAAQGTGEAVKGFAALGISVKNADGTLKGAGKVLEEVAGKFAGYRDGAETTALAVNLFGRSGADLIPLLNSGADGLREMTEEAAELGLVLDSETSKKAEAFNDNLTKLNAVKKGLVNRITAELLPSLLNLSERFVGSAKSAERLDQVARIAATGVKLLTSAGIIVAGVFKTLGEAIGGVAAAVVQLVTGNFKGAFETVKNYQLDVVGNIAGTIQSVRAVWDETASEIAADAPETSEKLAAPVIQAERKVKESTKKIVDEAEKTYKRIEDAIARIKRDIDTFGMTDEQVSLFDLKADGADPEQLKRAEALLETRRQLNEQERAGGVLADLQLEIEGLGKSNEYLATREALLRAGVDAESEFGQKISQTVAELYRQGEAIDDQIGFMDGLRDAGKGFFMDVTTGTKSFKDAALDAFDSLHQKILSMIAENLMDQLFGKQGDPGGGGWGNAIGSIFGSLFGGARAGGGDVASGRSYLVGEEGPEMFVPRTAGTIVPNEPAMAMAGGVGRGGPLVGAVNFNGYGRPDRRTAQQAAADVATVANRALARNGRGGR